MKNLKGLSFNYCWCSLAVATVAFSRLWRRKQGYCYIHLAAALREQRESANLCLLAGVAEERSEVWRKQELQHKHRLAQHNRVNRSRGRTGMQREDSSLFNPPGLSMPQFLTRICSSVVCASCWVLMSLHVTWTVVSCYAVRLCLKVCSVHIPRRVPVNTELHMSLQTLKSWRPVKKWTSARVKLEAATFESTIGKCVNRQQYHTPI
jgi:hypothetical protein